MTKRGQFLIYCVETYKNAKNLTGRSLAAVKLLPSIRMRMAFPRFFGSWGGVPSPCQLPWLSLFSPMEEQVRRKLPPILPAEEMPACPQVVADVSLVIGLAQLGLLPYAHKAGDACRLKGGRRRQAPQKLGGGVGPEIFLRAGDVQLPGRNEGQQKVLVKGKLLRVPGTAGKAGAKPVGECPMDVRGGLPALPPV